MRSRDGLHLLSDGPFKTSAVTAGAARAQPIFFKKGNKSKVANMCEYEDIKSSVDEATLLSNAHQCSEEVLRSASHETELLTRGLTTTKKRHAIAPQGKCLFTFPLGYLNYFQCTNNILYTHTHRGL